MYRHEQGSSMVKYLGFPITHTMKIKENYDKLIDRIKGKLQYWKNTRLSYGGKKVFIIIVL